MSRPPLRCSRSGQQRGHHVRRRLKAEQVQDGRAHVGEPRVRQVRAEAHAVRQAGPPDRHGHLRAPARPVGRAPRRPAGAAPAGAGRPRTGLRVCDDSGRGRPPASRSGAPVFLSRCTCAARGARSRAVRTGLAPGAAGARASQGRRCARWDRPCGAHHVLGVAVVGGHEPAPAHRRHLIQQLLRRRRRPRQPAGSAAARPRACRATPGRVASSTFTHASTAVHATTVASRSPVCPTMSARRARQTTSRRAAGDERSAGQGARARTCVGEVQADLAAVVLAGAQRLLAQVGDLAALHRRLFVERDVLVGRHLPPGVRRSAPAPRPQGGHAVTGAAAARLVPRLQRIERLACRPRAPSGAALPGRAGGRAPGTG
jgi:hypothetical protein